MRYMKGGGGPHAYVHKVRTCFTAQQEEERRTTAREFWATMYNLRVTYCENKRDIAKLLVYNVACVQISVCKVCMR